MQPTETGRTIPLADDTNQRRFLALALRNDPLRSECAADNQSRQI